MRVSTPYRAYWRTMAGKCLSSVPSPCSASSNGYPTTRRRGGRHTDARPSSHSRIMEDDTTSRVSNSFTKRSPLPLTRCPAFRPYPLGDQLPDELFRVHPARRMILKRIDLDERGPDAIGPGQDRRPWRRNDCSWESLECATARCRRSPESRSWQPPPETVCCPNPETRLRCTRLARHSQFHGRGEFQELDLLVEDLILEHPHDLETV